MKLKFFKAIANGYNRLLDAIFELGAWLIILMFVVICIQVFARLTPMPPVLWTTDIAMYFMIVLGFLGLGSLLRRGAHVSIDILVDLMPRTAQHVVGLITSVIGALSSLVVVYYGALVVINQIERKVFVNGSLFNMPKWILIAFIPVGFLIAFIEFIVIFYSHLKKLKTKESDKNCA